MWLAERPHDLKLTVPFIGCPAGYRSRGCVPAAAAATRGSAYIRGPSDQTVGGLGIHLRDAGGLAHLGGAGDLYGTGGSQSPRASEVVRKVRALRGFSVSLRVLAALPDRASPLTAGA